MSDCPAPARQDAAPDEAEAPKDVARQGGPSALRPDPQTDDGRHPIAWLHITAPKGAIPTATSVCDCGRNRSAVGRRQVLALVEEHTAHRDTCPLRHPDASETRTAS